MEIFTLDEKEEKSLAVLDKKYQKFIQKSLVSKGKDKVVELLPDRVKDFVGGKMEFITDSDVWKKVMEMAADGFMVLQGLASKYTIRESDIIKRFQKRNHDVNSLGDINHIRSYDVESIISSNDWKLYIQNITQAAPTGFAGMAGLPFNIVLATFLQFRAVQLIAIHYGYDVKNSQTEMDYASSVYLQIISKGKITDTDGYGEMIAKMMAQAELQSLKSALKSKTYAEMAEKGGLQLLYVQMRAIANKAAAKALNKAGQKEIENKALKKILEALAKQMAAKAGAKAVPIISAVLSVLIDTHQINKVITMANVIYQKRFLLEKEIRNNPDIEEESHVSEIEPSPYIN